MCTDEFTRGTGGREKHRSLMTISSSRTVSCASALRVRAHMVFSRGVFFFFFSVRDAVRQRLSTRISRKIKLERKKNERKNERKTLNSTRRKPFRKAKNRSNKKKHRALGDSKRSKQLM